MKDGKKNFVSLCNVCFLYWTCIQFIFCIILYCEECFVIFNKPEHWMLKQSSILTGNENRKTTHDQNNHFHPFSVNTLALCLQPPFGSLLGLTRMAGDKLAPGWGRSLVTSHWLRSPLWCHKGSIALLCSFAINAHTLSTENTAIK